MSTTIAARVGAVVLLSAFAGTSAAQITLLTDSRLVNGNVATPDESDNDILVPGAFGEAVDGNIQISALGQGAASAVGVQTSNIDMSQILGRGSAQVSLTPASVGTMLSIFEITFSLDVASLATLSVALSASGQAESSFVLIQQGEGVVAAGSGVFDLDLDAGTYLMRSVATSTADASQSSAPTGGAAGYVFDFTVVPTPASAGLLAAGGLLAARRRRG